MDASTTALVPAPVFAQVPFHDVEILAARVGDQIRVPMKPLCGTLGLPWDGQRQRIGRDELLSEGASMMLVPSSGGEQEMLTLPVELLTGFLFGVDVKRLRPELRARMTLFRRECFAVLNAHFGQPRREPPKIAPRLPVAPTWQELDAARRAAPPLLAAIAAETNPRARTYLHALLAHDADRLGVAVPRLGDLGEGPDDLIARLRTGLETLTARRVKWNHLGGSPTGRIAIVLPELARLFRRHDIDVPIDDRLRDTLASYSGARHRVRTVTLKSAIVRGYVHATLIEPWPFTSNAVEAIDGE